MPMKYDPDTGIPRYVPDLGEELEEGKTPEPKVISSKSDVFKGDKKLTKDEYEKLRDDVSDAIVPKLLAEAIRNAKPGKLDKDCATDDEITMLELACEEQTLRDWPIILRLLNRLRRAEGK